MLVTSQSSLACSPLRLFPVHIGKAIQIAETIQDSKVNAYVSRSEWNPLPGRDSPLLFFAIHAYQIGAVISNNPTIFYYKLERKRGVQK